MSLEWPSIWEFPKIRGYHFGGPHNKDYSILGPILGSPYFGKLPYLSAEVGGPSPQAVGLCLEDCTIRVPLHTCVV